MFSKLRISAKSSNTLRKLFVFDMLIPLIALILLGGWFLFNSFGSDRSFALWMDNEFFIGTVLNSIQNSLGSYNFPFRMDTILGGVPIYNFTQLSVFYPFYFTALPIFDGPLDIVHSLHWITLFHLFLLEINMYVFLRVAGTSKFAALIGAALFTFSANSLSYAVWVNITAPYAWLPLYLAGLVGILKHPGIFRYSMMAFVGIVFLTLASPAQPLIHAVLLTIIFGSAYSISALRNNKHREVGSVILRITVIALLSFLITAPAIFPAILEFKNMIRWIGPFPPVTGNAPIPFEAFQFDQLSIKDLGGIFFKFKEPAVGSQFVGVLVLALAGIAAVSRYKNWLVISLIFISIYALLSSTGANLGLAYLNYHIPILNKIREPSRFLILFQFAVCVLGALGIDELYDFASRRKLNELRKIDSVKWIAILITLFFATTTVFFARDHIISTTSPFTQLVTLIVLSTLTALLIHYKVWQSNKIVAVLWGSMALFSLSTEVSWTAPPISSSQFLQNNGPLLDASIRYVASLDQGRDYRVIFDGKVNKQEAAMLASYHNVRTLNSYLNPAPRAQFEELYYHGSREDNYFRILGAKYLICLECDRIATKNYKLIETIAGYEIYEAEDVLPRIYTVNKSNGEFQNLGDFTAKAASHQLSKGILFFEQSSNSSLSSDNPSSNSCLINEELRNPNRSRITLQCTSAGVLVMNEFFDKEWIASVDGSRIKALKVNGNQIGVPFTAGAHVIELRYLPKNFVISIVLMLTGFVILLALIVKKVQLIRRLR